MNKEIKDNDTEKSEGGAEEPAVEKGKYQGFDRGILEDFGRDAEEMEKANKLEPATRKDCLSLISEQSAEARVGFKEKFFKDHIQEIKDGGDYLDNGGSAYTERMFKKYGGEEALMSGKYPAEYQELTKLKLLQEGFNKDNIAPEFKMLMVNRLYTEMKKNKEEIEKIGDYGIEGIKKKRELETENEKLFSLSQNLSSNVLGRDIKKETEAENPYPNADDKKRELEKLVDSEYNKARAREDDDGKPVTGWDILAEYGYSYKKKGLIRPELVFYKDKKVLKSFKSDLLSEKIKDSEGYNEWIVNSLKGEIEKKHKDDFEKDWLDKNEKIKNNIRSNIEGKIEGIAKSPEKAIGGVEGYYDKVIESVLNEEREKARRIDVSKRKKAEVQEKEKATIPSKLLKGSRKLDLTGGFNKDINILRSFIEDEGFETLDSDVLNKNQDLVRYTKNYENYYKQKDGKYSRNIWEGFLMGLFNAIIKELASASKKK